jgi:hypothetical protein
MLESVLDWCSLLPGNLFWIGFTGNKAMTSNKLATWMILLAAGCLSSSARGDGMLPSGGVVKNVDFDRHLMGLFSKTGCNNGSCHGSFQGKNGFRLSLFAAEPDKDFAALTREIQGRRLNPLDPDNSLLLLKAIGAVKHDGGARFSKDSWQYQIFREWIASGMPRSKERGEVLSIEIKQRDNIFLKPGETTRLQVTARFADDTTEDITPFCDFRVQDDAIARVSPLGELTGIKPGDSGFVALYRGRVASARILVPLPPTQRAYPTPVNYIDREVIAKLKLLNVVPSDLASDSDFLRRITLDTTGGLPNPDEVRAFLNDPSPDKRAKKIEELLSNPLHAALWATKFSDITGNNTLALEQPTDMQSKRSQMWHDWLRTRFASNMPYDQIVKGILTATSTEGMAPEKWLDQVKQTETEADKFDTSTYTQRETLDLFWRRQGNVPIIEWGEKTAAAFLGVRLECAQCHKHPTDRWTQADYRAFANFFAGLGAANQTSSPALKKIVDAENKARLDALMAMGKNNNQRRVIREMHVLAEPRKNVFLTHPDTNQPLKPKALAGPEFDFEKGKDIRVGLYEWMRSPENPFFARSFVNRVWAHYFGIGLVDPVDDFSQANPPTNSRLLDALAKDFIDHKYDIHHLEKTILLSRTYQTSSVPNDTNKFDKVNYARSYIRPMMAEVVVDIVNDAIGVSEAKAPDMPEGKRMIEIGASRLNNGNLMYALRVFGRPARTTACDCERAMEPALPQTLFRMTDRAIIDKMDVARSKTNRVAKLIANKKLTDEQRLEELFLATLTRYPRPDEIATFKEHQAKTSAASFTDVMWALINTREFILNH